MSWINFRKKVALRWESHTSKCSFLQSLSFVGIEGKMTALSSDWQAEHWDSSCLELCCIKCATYPFPMDIARVAMQFGCRTRAGQRRGNWLSLFSHLHPLKYHEIVGTQKDALEIKEITPKREIESSILESLDTWCLYTSLKCHSMFPGNLQVWILQFKKE